MGRVQGIENIKDVMDKYSSSGADFFVLKNDQDSAVVRFLHKDDKDLDIYIVHKVKIDGKDKYIECTKEGGHCALCEAGHQPTVRGFFQLIDIRDGKRKLWDRGKQEITSIISFIAKYGDLDKMDIEVKRNGKANDNKTTYIFLPERETREMTLEERPEICGPDKFVKSMSYEEVKAMLPNLDLNASANTNYTPKATGGTGKMF